MKKTFTLVLFCFIYQAGIAQTNIGGVVNIYTKVTSITNCSCPTPNCATISVSSTAGFAAGDTIIIMQMKGARVDSSNTSAHGSILNLYDAGNYEFAKIYSIAGSVITTAKPLRETYFTNANPSDSAYVQIIREKVYTGNVNVTSTLKPKAWNPATGTGGVLTIYVSGTLTLQANINADSAGFRAARYLKSPISCSLDTNFYYQSTIWNYASCTTCGYIYDDVPTRKADVASFGGCSAPCTTNRMSSSDLKQAGYRGEGISANTFKKTFANANVAYFDMGKAKWANGGGGGGNHNAGGGGGGNYGVGGWGGNAFNIIGGGSGCTAGTLTVRKGYGGVALVPTGSKVYMGGGGGEGHDDGGQGTTGTSGGGIIFIHAANFANGGTYTISANGVDQTLVSIGDGAGGGGAGGTILLDFPGTFTGPTTISAKGGKGGNHNNNTCHGTGGGGGGGVVWFSSAALSDDANPDVSGGANGVQVAASIDCGDINWGATSGGSGTVLLGNYAGATSFFNTMTCPSLLPVKLVSFTGKVVKDKVQLDWATASETNNKSFIVEKSTDGRSFTDLETIDGAGNSTVKRTYRSLDFHPSAGTSYYRLRQMDYNGEITYSKIVDVNVQEKYEVTVIPNPVKANKIKVIFPEIPNSSCRISINDRAGKIIYNKNISPQDFDKSFDVQDIRFGTSGLYYLSVEIDGIIYREKISFVDE